MSGFDPDWLALREPYDHAVRDRDLTTAFVKALGPSPRLIDLGCGSGSNLRYLAPHLPQAQRWICIDHDPALLTVLEANRPSGVTVRTACLDLAAGLADVPIEPGMGVTAAALLDLTSRVWLDRLVERCRLVPVLMTLSVDGEMAWAPADPMDGPICDAFWRHQGTDKGFGPALGSEASCYLADRFRRLGHDVRSAKSDWELGAPDHAILDALLQGIAAAAGEIEPALPIGTWLERRIAEAKAGHLTLRVGHDDLLALPR